MSTVLVTSAAGGVGRPLVRGLSTRGVTVRALVKNDAQASLARRDGATEIRVGDMRDNAVLDEAIRGVDGMYHAAPTQIIDEGPIAEQIIDRLRAAGMQQVMIFDDDDQVRIQALGSQPVRVL